MTWRTVHRWLGLVAGALAVVLGVSGSVLALEPLTAAWRSPATPPALSVATLAQRVSAALPEVVEIRRRPSGEILAFGAGQGQAQGLRIDPAEGRVLGPAPRSAVLRWVRALHRSFLLGESGRGAAAAVALALLGLSVSGLVLVQRRLGGWHRLGTRLRGTPLQRLHGASGRVTLAVLLLSATTALLLSAAHFGLLPLAAEGQAGLPPAAQAPSHPARPAAPGATAAPTPGPGQLPLLQALRVDDLHRLSFPDPQDPGSAWSVTTAQGQGWIDRGSGQTLAWQDAGATQRLLALAQQLHTGAGAWVWALVLGLAAASMPLFWVSGVLLWWRQRQPRPALRHNSPAARAQALIFVASEGGSTWGFAQALHEALVRSGQRVHSAGLEHFATRVAQAGAARHIFVLAATYGDGQAPAHAAQALAQVGRTPAGPARVTVLGFGDRQYARFCAFAQALDQRLRERGWPMPMPLHGIHQQSAQDFARWGQELAQTLALPLALDYRPRLPRLTALQLISRRDFGDATAAHGPQPVAVLRFALPARTLRQRLLGQGLRRFVAGDLLGVLAPGASAPRFYSLASGTRDGFVELCVRRVQGGRCSSFLHALQPGETVQAFVRANPGFTLAGDPSPVLLIGAGTGVAPLAGFVRGNARRRPLHLYLGARNPEQDDYFRRDLQRWQGEQRLSSLRTAFSRVPGGGYVQDLVRADAAPLSRLLAGGASVRVCGSRPMAQAVAQTLDGILAPLRLSVAQLKAAGRYAEDVF